MDLARDKANFENILKLLKRAKLKVSGEEIPVVYNLMLFIVEKIKELEPKPQKIEPQPVAQEHIPVEQPIEELKKRKKNVSNQ